jgi:hypothetical protein
MNNESAFFASILELEDITVSEPLSHDEIMHIFMDVARNYRASAQLYEFVKRIEQVHGIGVNYGRIKN